MKYDVVVIGGGPAGMMAAGRAGQSGARVLLLEKNKSLGIKLLMTGNSRCNLTNQTENIHDLTDKFGKNGRFLFSALSKFGPLELINFFEERGLETKTENAGRVFPVSDRAQDVLIILEKYLEESGVKVMFNSPVAEIKAQDNKIEKAILTDGQEVFGDNFIICTGGQSYPASGSSGDAYGWLESLGHHITSLSPALAPIIIKDKIIGQLEGISFDSIALLLLKNNKKISLSSGPILFTADGLSGPAIINLSRLIGREINSLTANDKLELSLDFKVSLPANDLDKELRILLETAGRKEIKNILSSMFPERLALVFLLLAEIIPEKKGAEINQLERRRLVSTIKDFRLEIKAVANYDKAMLTAGGLDLKEVDPQTMCSKIYNNLYLAGEVLDLDGPTGGYNLQVCWSTGYVAGMAVGKNVN